MGGNTDMKFLLLLMLSFPALAGEFYAQWTDPDMRENGSPFIANEFQGTRVTYYKNANHQYTVDVGPESNGVLVSGLSGGWWNIYLQSKSHCHTVQYGSSTEDFLTHDLCYSEPTTTLRIKAR
jgi:hypothetical protein